jgi:hypothetical protein
MLKVESFRFCLLFLLLRNWSKENQFSQKIEKKIQNKMLETPDLKLSRQVKNRSLELFWIDLKNKIIKLTTKPT